MYKMYYTYEGTNKSKSIIDYMFVNEHCKISDYYSQYLISGNRKNSVSDHKAIYVKIEIDSIVRGPNYWKMNMSFLENENYIRG